jgi:membrane protein YqaA with SNARE-associated domain
MNKAADKPRSIFWTRERFFQILALLLTLGFCFTILLHREDIAQLQVYGYFGVFLVSVISSSTIVVPVPGWIIVATLGAILNPVLVGIVSGVGGTIGEMTGYALGYGGRIAVDQIRIYPRMVQWMTKWGSLTIFFLALIPNPLFDVAGAIAGLLHFPLWKFLLLGAAGRIPKHIFFAYIGLLGFQFLSL